MTKVFHDEEEGNPEPIPGLPEALPEGEHILWQGKPKMGALAVHALHVRFVAAYFVVFTGLRVAAIAAQNGAAQKLGGVILVSSLAAVGSLGLLYGLAWLMSRATIYTITNKRVVLRHGVAIRKYINVPFSEIETAALTRHGGTNGSIAMATTNKPRMAFLNLWPHARPWRFAAPQPMLRTIENAEDVARILCDAVKACAPSTVNVMLDGAATDDGGDASASGSQSESSDDAVVPAA